MQSEYGLQVTFLSWLLVGMPIVVVFLPIAWWVLTRWVYPIHVKEIPGGKEIIRRQLAEMGPMTRAEKRVLGVFLLTAALWLFRPLIWNRLDDSMIAMFGAMLLFFLPAGDEGKSRLLDWEATSKISWGVLILFGGGLSLAAALKSNGVAEFIGNGVSGLAGMPVFVVILLTAIVMVLLTELTSNTATTAAFLPILAAVSAGLNLSPVMLTVPAVLAASCAFMMPVATPPNAIVFASGYVTIPQMVKAGIWLILIGALLISTFSYTLLETILL
jgi:sodium-dependent dicarboxylate transporter 2/3/5